VRALSTNIYMLLLGKGFSYQGGLGGQFGKVVGIPWQIGFGPDFGVKKEGKGKEGRPPTA